MFSGVFGLPYRLASLLISVLASYCSLITGLGFRVLLLYRSGIYSLCVLDKGVFLPAFAPRLKYYVLNRNFINNT